MSGFLTGKVAVVTGAGGGIGRAYALGLAREGANVVVSDIDDAGAAETVSLIASAGGVALPIGCDVGDEPSVLALADAVRRSCGSAHILVNNAAIYRDLQPVPLRDISLDYWRHVFAVNVEGTLTCSRAFAPMMIEAGWGRIVNQSSVGAFMGRSGVYAMTKLVVAGLTQALASELGRYGITVNAIAPGTIHTDATRKVVPEELRQMQLAKQYVKLEAEAEHVVGTLLYLVGDGAGFVSGQTIFVDGGAVPHL